MLFAEMRNRGTNSGAESELEVMAEMTCEGAGVEQGIRVHLRVV